MNNGHGVDYNVLKSTFFKCIRWQEEETLDPMYCPHHYYCVTTYASGSYPPSMDILALLFIIASYLTTLCITIREILRSSHSPYRSSSSSSRRHFLVSASGPFFLPVTLLVLANGHWINTLFPLATLGPAILQLLQISALAFELSSPPSHHKLDHVKYNISTFSEVSGILHASLYLDSIILPYYTGLDAFLFSTFSGECESCICRKDVLAVGGKSIFYLHYRGWSITTFLVAITLSFRIVGKSLVHADSENIMQLQKTIMLAKVVMECLGWISLTADCMYMMLEYPSLPPEMVYHSKWMQKVALGCILALICLNVLRKACTLASTWHRKFAKFTTHKSLCG